MHPAARQQCTSSTALRDHLRVRIARALTPRDNALTVLCWGFNYVVEAADRRSSHNMETTGGRDRGEESHFQKRVAALMGSSKCTKVRLRTSRASPYRDSTVYT